MGITKKALRNLKALHAGIYTLRHIYLDVQEAEKIRSCIKGNFIELDKEGVSFRLQNKIIHLAETGEDFSEIYQFLD